MSMKYTSRQGTHTTIKGADTAPWQKGTLQKSWHKTMKGLAALAVFAVAGSSCYPSATFAQAHDPANSALNEPAHPEALSQSGPESETSLPSSTIQLSGQFSGFIPGTNHILTYHSDTDSSILQNEQGREIAVLAGSLTWFNPNGESIITVTGGVSTNEPSRTHLYDVLGNKLATLDGSMRGFSPDGQYFVIATTDDPSTHLYHSTGEKITSLTGLFAGFSPHSQQMRIIERASLLSEHQVPAIESPPEGPMTRLYNIAENTMTHMAGSFDQFNNDGSRLVTYDADDAITYLYDDAGRELARFLNHSPAEFYGEDSIFATVTQGETGESQWNTILYDRDGEQLATLVGYLIHINEAATHFVTSSLGSDLEKNTDYLYDLSGRQIATFPYSTATSWAFTQRGNLLLRNSYDSETTTVYEVATGNELMGVEGNLSTALVPGEIQFVTHTEYGRRGERAHFYDASANKMRSLPGIFESVSNSGELIAIVDNWDERPESLDDTVDSLNPTTHIYDQAGNKIASVAGDIIQFSDDDSRVVTDAVLEEVYHLLILPSPQ